ncbi:restriction endonuclease subunit S [Streptococcus sp. HMSC10E12]|uniref:restriction endonuclease subunit S n=1 Tax=Streptococcus sp. HMSC10E12 TaxID=1581080 RepID=UPI0008A152BA|nr:restriction endonuclease subunit S [Streptococcus sp. HMSC10E12]OFU82964.1 hypothetical protein HMPREF3112_09215 [Streptococcus sp. HMSC10E12]
MTNSKYVPKRRFKEFELDDEWEQLKLGEHANILTGGTPNTSISSYWEPKEIPWMSSGEVNRRRLDKTDNMISNDGIRNSSARWVKKHSILIALAGQGKTRGMVAVNNIPLTTNQSIAAIEPDKTLNYEFVFQNLSKRYDELRLISSGDGSRGGLNKQIVSDISIACPNVNEQELIGNFLADFDSLITMNQHKLDKLIDLKKAYLSEMFPAEGERVPKRRFPGFEGEWEQKKLTDLLSLLKDGTHGTHQDVNKGPLLLSAKNIKGGDIIWDETDRRISLEEYMKIHSKFVLNSGDILLTIVGSIGEAAVLEDASNITFQRSVAFLRPNKTVSTQFLYTKIQTKEFQKELDNRKSTSAQPGIYLGDLESIPISFTPLKKEQNKIGKFFEALDQLVTLQQQKLDKLNDLKKAYLNELFV